MVVPIKPISSGGSVPGPKHAHQRKQSTINFSNFENSGDDGGKPGGCGGKPGSYGEKPGGWGEPNVLQHGTR